MATPTSKLQSSMKTLSLDSSSSKVRVVLRVRPFLPSEIDAGERNPIPCVAVLNPEHQIGEEVTVHLKDQYSSRNECYKLDSFFGQDEPVAQIFHHEVCAVIPEIFQGLNATVFAYGATGSGKTYTMQGTQDEPGLIPLAALTVLSRCESTQCRVEISYYEVYMDRCYDLLEPKAKEIMTLDDRDGQLQLKGLSSIPVDSMDEFFDVFATGVQRRKVAHTNLNDVSSRSHGVLVIHITNGSVRGKLNFIDLAGNEDNRRTCNEGIRLQESAKINQSLFALSNVIYALNNNEPRIPYRESKLTRILQDSLGGPSRALMVACLNPAAYQEAVHTVSLAARSRQIVNYSGSSNKKDAAKEKVDMEAKLKAWLESKGKMRCAQRPNGPLSPSKGRTPASLNYLKSIGNVRSSVKVKIADSNVTNLKGRKLFESDTPVSVKKEIGDFPHQTSLDNKEEKSIGATTIKENVHPPSNTIGSSPSTQRIQDLQKSPEKVLSTVSSNMTPIQHVPTDDEICHFEPKTPKAGVSCSSDIFNQSGTPLDIFNQSGFHLKESLAQQYLSFLNVASREELMQLKGIGEKRAEYIIELRENSPKPLKSLSDLEKIGLSSRQVHGMFKMMAGGFFS